MAGYLATLVSAHGYGVVALVVALESMGLPLPGETTLVTAALYAGTTHRLDIGLIIAAAAAGAVVGDNLGFWIGRRVGHRLLLRYGRLVGVTDGRIKLGQWLFARHGGLVVFFGRFVAVLRAVAALLAGANCMRWWRFLLFNATGGMVWATVYGLGAYLLGRQFERLHGPMAMAGIVLAVMAVAGSIWFMRRHEAALQAEADRLFPGSVRSGAHGCD